MSSRFKQWLNNVKYSPSRVNKVSGVTSRGTISQIKVMEVRIWVNKRSWRSKHGPNDGYWRLGEGQCQLRGLICQKGV